MKGTVPASLLNVEHIGQVVRFDQRLDDAYDYHPIQAITGKPLGWYSGDDGEVCPEYMTRTMRGDA